METALARSRCR